MEKGKRIETQLPEAMIQHIQCFLSGKEAARTTILSKSWYTAWLTRPNLDFAERDFPCSLGFDRQSPSESSFVKVATKTMQRYGEMNRTIQSLGLQMYGSSIHSSFKISMANQLIAKAMKLGATDLDLEFTGKDKWTAFDFVLPHEVLESETLVRLSLVGAKIDRQDRKVSCSRLESIILSRVCIDCNNLWDIISISPSIEKLVLSECNYNSTMLILNPGSRVDHFHKLRVLSLENVIIAGLFFRDISRFPYLKELTIKDCVILDCFGNEINFCSNSLLFINFTPITTSRLRMEFDVPKIRKFKFSSYKVPSLSFKTTSREWETDVSIRGAHIFQNQLKTSWFHELREFLLDLSSSKIYLSLEIILLPNKSIPSKEGRAYTGDIIPRVEKLTFLMHAPSSLRSTILEDLFWSCRPNLITLYWLPSSPCLPMSFSPFTKLGKKQWEENSNFSKLLCNTLENRNISALHDLVETSVEFFEDNGRSLPWKTLSEALENLGNIKIEVCFQLKWA